MKVIQGFVSIQNHISNIKGEVSEFFELSPFALTFSKNRTEYQSPDAAGKVLHVFAAKDYATDTDFILTTQQVNNVLLAVETVMAYSSAQGLNFNSGRFISYVMAYSDSFMRSFSHGVVRNQLYPEWISWVDTEGIEHRIWLASSAFESQYANYEITFIPPFDDVGDFFGNYATAATRLENRTLSDFMSDIQDAKENIPESCVRSLTVKFYNKNTLSHPVPQYTNVDLGFLIYGAAGDNIDNLKDAVANYLLTTTTHTAEEWEEILPEIFKRTEFIFYPCWHKISIENSTPQASLYSSVYNLNEVFDHVRGLAEATWTDNELLRLTEVIPFDYKALVSAVVPGTTNDIGTRSIAALFSDYLPLSTQELDFNRASIRTRNWVLLVVGMMQFAESATEFSTVLSPYRRVKRNGKIYLSFLYENINYLVYIKNNGDAHVPD